MVPRACKVTEMASSSIRGCCGGPRPLHLPRGGPLTEQSGSKKEQQASLHVSAVMAAFNLIASVLQERGLSQILHMPHYVSQLLLQHLSKSASKSVRRIGSPFPRLIGELKGFL